MKAWIEEVTGIDTNFMQYQEAIEAGLWPENQDLKSGDKLLDLGGAAVSVAATTHWTANAQVHNISVADLHTYFVLVGDTPVLVHNCSPRAYEIADKTIENHGLMGFDSADDMASYIDDVADSQPGILRDDGAFLYRDGD